MNPTPQPASRPEDEFETAREKRAALKVRHAKSLTTLMNERDDLRGVHALADFVDDAVRWTA
jgi:hypothetical protein